ncbi:hypothetical protein BHE74_00058434, partial [Ensete ventricosum]
MAPLDCHSGANLAHRTDSTLQTWDKIWPLCHPHWQAPMPTKVRCTDVSRFSRYGT